METKSKLEEQVSLTLNPIDMQTPSLITAIKKNDKKEFFRLLNLQKSAPGTKIIDEVDMEYSGNALHIAISCGHINFIIHLIQTGIDVNHKNKNGCTPVYMASANGCVDAIAVLKTAGANVNTPDRDGRTPVFIAAQNGHSDAITILKTIDASMIIYKAARDINIATDSITALVKKCLSITRNGIITVYNRRTSAIDPLSMAKYAIRAIVAATVSIAAVFVAKRGEIARHTSKVILALLGSYILRVTKRIYANVNTPDQNGRTPVYIAAQNGYAEAITALKMAGANVNMPNKNGETQVYIAAQLGHAEAIAALKAAGANVNTPDRDGRTPVYIAAQNGHAKVIAALHTAGADVNMQEKTMGATPVYIAAQLGHAEAIAALKAAGANVNTPRNDGKMPVYIAVQNGHEKAIRALHAAGANMNTPDWSGETLVYIAAQLGHVEAIAALKAAGADVNTPDWDGRTPVYIAAQNGHAEVITALHAAGAGVNVQEKMMDATPIFIAVQNGHARAVDALLKAGADASIKNKWGITVFEMASVEVISILKAHFRQHSNRVNSIVPVTDDSKEASEAATSLMFSSTDVVRLGTTIYSTVDPRIPITYYHWVVSIMRKPYGDNPEHAFLVLEGINKAGKGVLKRYDLVENRTNPEYADILDRSLDDVDPEQMGLVFRRDLMKQATFYHQSWSISYEKVQILIEDVDGDKRKRIEYCMSGSESLYAKSSYNNPHSCFTWAREKLHNLEEERIRLPEHWTDFLAAKTSFYISDTGKEQSFFQYARHISRYPIDNPMKAIAGATAIASAYYYKDNVRKISYYPIDNPTKTIAGASAVAVGTYYYKKNARYRHVDPSRSLRKDRKKGYP